MHCTIQFGVSNPLTSWSTVYCLDKSLHSIIVAYYTPEIHSNWMVESAIFMYVLDIIHHTLSTVYRMVSFCLHNYCSTLCIFKGNFISCALCVVLFPQTVYVNIDYLRSQFLVLGRALGLNEKSKNIFLCTQ